jgi:hypothetical protein
MEKEARNLFGMGQTALGNANRPTVNRAPLWSCCSCQASFRLTVVSQKQFAGEREQTRECANDESVKSQRNTALFRCTYGAYPAGLESNNPKAIASGPSRC